MVLGWFKRQTGPILAEGDLVLRPAIRADYSAWRALRATSHSFLKPYEPRWSTSDLSQQVFQSRIMKGQKDRAAGEEFSLFLFQQTGKEVQLIGGLTVSNIRRRIAMQANLGYWMGAQFAGHGHMSRAVAMVIPFIFTDLGLNRINAACLKDNIASRRVLEKNGFREEGLAEAYLKIDGEWRDHVLYGLTRARHEGTTQQL